MNQWSALGDISALRDGDSERFGVGSEYKVVRGRSEMIEQIVAVMQGTEMRYRLLRRGPFENLSGELRLEEQDGCTQLSWIIRFRCKLPLTGWLLKLILHGRYRKSLDQLKGIFGT